MKRFGYRFTSFVLFAFYSLILITGGCAPRARVPISTLDTPEHHVFSGMKLLESGWLLDAEREFNQAKELDHKYSPAYRGLGLVLGYKRDFNSAFKTMSQAEKLAESKQESALTYVGIMRLYTQQKGKDWLEDVERYFEKARKILTYLPDLPDPYFYMGIAYKEAYRFSNAAEAFKKVMEVNKALVGKAERQLKLVQKIELAMPETVIGKKVALQEKVKRLDAAALFIQELKLDTIYEKFRPDKYGASFKSPGGSLSPQEIPVPVDVQGHPLETDVRLVIALRIKGLGTFPDGSFAPHESITRASYAMMIADIIGTITNDPALATKYIGSVSPFDDVRNDAPYFNAIMICTTRGIIEAKGGIRENIFDPMGSVLGADALLSIRKLKEALKIV
jgi:tetratricopeptide (TPR) repeat protein